MITGSVTAAREAIITLAVRGSDGREEEFEAVIDTGFDGFLTLPTHLLNQWQLRRTSRRLVLLADGSATECDIYEAEVHWDGRWFLIPIEAVDTAPLVGMALLAGFDLRMQVRPGGKVTIEAIPD